MRRRPRPSISVFLLLLALTLVSCLGYYRLVSSSAGFVFPSPLQSSGSSSSTQQGQVGVEGELDKIVSMPGSESQSLAAVLAKQKKALLERLSQPEKQDGSEPFVIIMGNEAGDTDSLASSVMLCHLLSSSSSSSEEKKDSLASQFPKGTTFVPLQQLPRADLGLRAENEMLLSLLKISSSDLLFWDDLPSSSMSPRKDIMLGLTDHPQLSGLWKPYEEWSKKVDIIVDHHADDGAHADAKIRILRGPNNGAIGSDVSVVVDLFKDSPALHKLPKEIVDLALAALLIDTSDLRPTPGGKATPTDLAAGEILLKLSSFSRGASANSFISTAVQIGGQVAADAAKLKPESSEEMSIETADLDSQSVDRASAFFRVLSALKLDVSRLNTLDLLRRDYKESDVSLSPAGDLDIRAGFSSVPVGISDWVHGRHGDGAERWDGYWKALQDWMKQKSLDVAVVGTSFRDGGSEDGEKGKHKRELLLAYKEKTASSSTSSLFPSLVKYLETESYSTEMGNDVNLFLGLDSPWKGWRRVAETGKKERIGGLDKEGRWSGDAELRVAVWLQRNGQASRKVYLPAVVHALKKAAKGKA